MFVCFFKPKNVVLCLILGCIVRYRVATETLTLAALKRDQCLGSVVILLALSWLSRLCERTGKKETSETARIRLSICSTPLGCIYMRLHQQLILGEWTLKKGEYHLLYAQQQYISIIQSFKMDYVRVIIGMWQVNIIKHFLSFFCCWGIE